jgi:hypothetical protein
MSGADPSEADTLAAGDYVSPGLSLVIPDRAFPDLAVGDQGALRRPRGRAWVGHRAYIDRREPGLGLATRDEAAILHNMALRFEGLPALQVGCGGGWSAVHLALGGVALDVIDPRLADSGVAASMRAAGTAAGIADRVTLHPGVGVAELAAATGRRWPLIVVEGEDEGERPLLAAEAALQSAGETALVVFRGLATPRAAAGLALLARKGWRTRLYQTMHVMAAAWRGNVQPPGHIPDPRVGWTLPRHLAGYEVSGWSSPPVGAWHPEMTPAEQRDAALASAQAAADDAAAAVDRAISAEAERDIAVANLRSTKETHDALLRRVADLKEEAARSKRRLRAALQRPSARAVQAFRRWEEEDLAIRVVAAWAARRSTILRLLLRPKAARAAKLERKARTNGLGAARARPLAEWLREPANLVALLWRPPRAAEARLRLLMLSGDIAGAGAEPWHKPRAGAGAAIAPEQDRAPQGSAPH